MISGCSSIAMSQRTPSQRCGDGAQLADLRLAEAGVPVVELERVRPAVEVGIAAVGEDRRAARAATRGDARVVLRLAREVVLAAVDVVLGVRGHPGVIAPGVVGHEVEQQLQPAARQPIAQARQRLVAAEVLVDAIGDDRERRAGDVLLAQVGEIAAALLHQLRIRTRDLAPDAAGLPDAQEPDPREPLGRDVVEERVRDVVQRRGALERDAPLLQEDARVDLVEQRVVHGLAPGASRSRCFARSASLTSGAMTISGFSIANRCVSAGMTALHPVWWLAPSPAPLSPW